MPLIASAAAVLKPSTKPMPGLITKAQLARVAPHAIPAVVTAIVDHAPDVLPRYGLVTPRRIQHFMAQVLVESAYLTVLFENLSYSAKRLTQVWPHRFPTLAAALPFEHRPQALAGVVYGGRMGNTSAAEAYANRGQGLLQATGHDNIAALGKRLDADIDQARAMLTAPEWMLECAVATFVALGCLSLADRNDGVGVSRAINGGTNGLAERADALDLCRKVWTPVAVINPKALIPRPAALPLAA